MSNDPHGAAKTPSLYFEFAAEAGLVSASIGCVTNRTDPAWSPDGNRGPPPWPKVCTFVVIVRIGFTSWTVSGGICVVGTLGSSRYVSRPTGGGATPGLTGGADIPGGDVPGASTGGNSGGSPCC
jgi:hypothetical protein